jgi:peroxiredoxin
MDEMERTLLVGLRLPPLLLPSCHGTTVDLARLPPRSLLILHPLALARAQVPPPGWLQIPGAAGCTAQLLGFAAEWRAFRALRIALFGVSTQAPLVQRAVAEDLALPFPLLSDASGAFAHALNLPMLRAGRRPRLARLVLVVLEGRIAEIFDPIVDPALSAATVLTGLAGRPL